MTLVGCNKKENDAYNTANHIAEEMYKKNNPNLALAYREIITNLIKAVKAVNNYMEKMSRESSIDYLSVAEIFVDTQTNSLRDPPPKEKRELLISFIKEYYEQNPPSP